MAVQVLQGKIDFSYPTLPSPAQTWYQVYGNLTCDDPSIVPVIVLHGGPGLPHDYVLPIADLANEDMADGKPAIPVIFYDQIGNGLSTHYPEKKGDEAFWTIDLWIAELENLLQHFGFGSKQFDILGQSWGGMLGAEFAVRQPVGLRRLIISNSPASISLWKESMNRLRATLPSEVQDVLTTGEKEGQFDSEEYLNASQVFNEQFICRVTPWPQDLVDAFDWLTQKDPTVYSTLYVLLPILLNYFFLSPFPLPLSIFINSQTSVTNRRLFMLLE